MTDNRKSARDLLVRIEKAKPLLRRYTGKLPSMQGVRTGTINGKRVDMIPAKGSMFGAKSISIYEPDMRASYRLEPGNRALIRRRLAKK